jgi:hypothetical protein
MLHKGTERMPRHKSTKPRITVPIPSDVGEQFYAFVEAQNRTAASAALYLIRLGLKAKERGEEIAWERPPRVTSPAARRGSASSAK